MKIWFLAVLEKCGFWTLQFLQDFLERDLLLFVYSWRDRVGMGFPRSGLWGYLPLLSYSEKGNRLKAFWDIKTFFFSLTDRFYIFLRIIFQNTINLQFFCYCLNFYNDVGDDMHSWILFKFSCWSTHLGVIVVSG